MEGTSLKDKYAHLYGELARLSHAADIIDETNVYQEANMGTRRMMNEILQENLLPDSRLEGRENFAAFTEALKNGKRGLILMEHYSNFDLPSICYLLERDEGDFGKELASRLVAIAGMKLNEENPMVKAWAEGFTRIVIYPSRSLALINDSETRALEEARSRKINRAGMRALDNARKRGQAILVFPSGTRYRPGQPETKRGVREIDSYLRLFDVMILVSMNGNCLRIDMNAPNDMLSDRIVKDTLILAASPVIECAPYREATLASHANDTDPKQATVDRIMEMLEEQHAHYEKIRLAN
jgi:glycerol-3-phosphate O-acyltransferase